MSTSLSSRTKRFQSLGTDFTFVGFKTSRNLAERCVSCLTTSRQASAIGDRLSAIGYRLSAIGDWRLAIGVRWGNTVAFRLVVKLFTNRDSCLKALPRMDRRGIEPRLPACKTGVFPLDQQPLLFFLSNAIFKRPVRELNPGFLHTTQACRRNTYRPDK